MMRESGWNVELCDQENQRWLWHAIDHHSGKILAYVFGAYKDEVFLQLKALLEPLALVAFILMDGSLWAPFKSSYARRESRTRKNRKQIFKFEDTNCLVRKTICFSKTIIMHDIVIGLFINRYEFGLSI